MNNKMSFMEKLLEASAFVLLLLTITVKCIFKVQDMDILITISFVGIMVYVILLVCSFFPADWRMTAKQKEKIHVYCLSNFQFTYSKICGGI